MSSRRGHAPKRHWRPWKKEKLKHEEAKIRDQRQQKYITEMINDYHK